MYELNEEYCVLASICLCTFAYVSPVDTFVAVNIRKHVGM